MGSLLYVIRASMIKLIVNTGARLDTETVDYFSASCTML